MTMINVPKEVLMSNGAVLRCRAVPPYAQAAIRMQLPEPPYPRVDVTSAAGGTEVHPALPGTPEYIEYRRASDRHRIELGAALNSFNMNYGVLDWRLPEDDETTPWQDMPSEGWKLPMAMQLYGIDTDPSPAGWRAQFIQHELVTTDIDQEAVDSILMPAMPLTKREILAALDPFGSDEEIDLLIILQVARPV